MFCVAVPLFNRYKEWNIELWQHCWPWRMVRRSCLFLFLFNGGLGIHVWFYKIVLWLMNAICDRWKDACDAPFSGTSATKTVERHGLCLCCAERKLWLDVHSNCMRSGDVCSKFCIPTKQIEQCKVCANWIPHMLNEEWHATNVLLATADIQWSKREGALYFSWVWKWKNHGCTHIMHD